MRIKPRPSTTRKQKAYLKWMGLIKPKGFMRLPQLNKFHKTRRVASEFVTMARSLESASSYSPDFQ